MPDEERCDQSCPLARREFLGAAALAALALLEAACGDGQIGPTIPGTSSGGSATLVVSLSQYPALAGTSGLARVDGGSGRPVALARTSATTFVALSLRCTHEGFTVDVTGSSLYCPAHGARFTNRGVWQGGQRTTNLVTLPSTYDPVTGTVTISR